jgi:hypothetical protein
MSQYKTVVRAGRAAQRQDMRAALGHVGDGPYRADQRGATVSSVGRRRLVIARRVARDQRRPPSGARLLRVSHAHPDCAGRVGPASLGWVVATGAFVFVCVLGLGLFANAMSATAEIPDSTTVLWVRSGESLWDIARRVAPDADRGVVIDRIKELNGMSDVGLVPGQPLLVPGVGDG